MTEKNRGRELKRKTKRKQGNKGVKDDGFLH